MRAIDATAVQQACSRLEHTVCGLKNGCLRGEGWEIKQTKKFKSNLICFNILRKICIPSTSGREFLGKLVKRCIEN